MLAILRLTNFRQTVTCQKRCSMTVKFPSFSPTKAAKPVFDVYFTQAEGQSRVLVYIVPVYI